MDVIVANKSHIGYASVICSEMQKSAKVRGTGIAKRSVEYIVSKMEDSQSVIALDKDNLAGFCYIETWGGDGKFVANSGLIVLPEYRNKGLAKKIKTKIFEYSQYKYPNSKFFGITTGLAVMKINYELGYRPVTFSELPRDSEFWKGCQTCKNYDVLTRTDFKMCLCTGMLYDAKEKKTRKFFNKKVLERLKKIKQTLFLTNRKK